MSAKARHAAAHRPAQSAFVVHLEADVVVLTEGSAEDAEQLALASMGPVEAATLKVTTASWSASVREMKEAQSEQVTPLGGDDVSEQLRYVSAMEDLDL